MGTYAYTNKSSKDEFLDLLDEALFETRDMLSAIESGGEECELVHSIGVFEALENILVGLYADVRDHRHAVGGRPLSYMDLVTRFRSRIPFADVLETLNKVKRNGF